MNELEKKLDKYYVFEKNKEDLNLIASYPSVMDMLKDSKKEDLDPKKDYYFFTLLSYEEGNKCQ